MNFAREVFIKYWKEVIIAVMSAATLPFFRRYGRMLRMKVTAFFTKRKRLEAALLEAESRCREAEEQLKQERTARKEAEQKYLAEAEEKRKAQAEAARLRKELEQERDAYEEAERLRRKYAPERKLPEEAKPAAVKLTSRLLELLRACEEQPYPKETSFIYLLKVRYFIPSNGDVVRMKIMKAIKSYILGASESNSPNGSIHKKCTVFYVLMIIAQGVSEGQISIGDSEILTWKAASLLLDKVNAEYFKRHPEASKPSKETAREARKIIADAFSLFPPEIIIEDKEFIQALLPSTKSAAVVQNKSKGLFGRLFG